MKFAIFENKATDIQWYEENFVKVVTALSK